MGPTVLFDKSALQALSMDESVWFDTFFGVNVVPIFYVETLADLEKELADGKSAEDLVGMLAVKTPSNAFPNVHHRTLLSAELDGHKVELDGRPVISAGKLMKTEDGSVGVHIEEFPEQAALLRWQDHNFLEIERGLAKGWRADLAAHDPERLIGMVKNVLPAELKISSLGQLKEFVDRLCASTDPHILSLALEFLDLPEAQRRRGLGRWEWAGKPNFDEFFPYVAHVFKVDLVFYLGIHRGFISGKRASNRADMAYLYYLPFGATFTSGDRLHRMTVPLFLRDNQTYLEASELKSALAEMDAHYDALPREIKEMGALAFASYPPSGMDNAVTRLWDSNMRPDWREVAKTREAELGKPRDERADQKTLDDLKERLSKAEPVSEEEVDSSVRGPDYFVTSRRVRVKKGKWRMVSQEVEDAGEDG